MFRRLFFVILLIILTAPLPYAKELPEIKILSVHDGDTVTILTKSRQKLKIRLDGIDAPELNQPYGQQSKAYLMKLLRDGKSITIKTKGKDVYARTLGVFYAGKLDINAKMVADGYAWSYRPDYKNNRLGLLERDARNNKFGLWSDSKKPVPPWEFRKNERAYTYEYSKPLIDSPIKGIAICIDMRTNEISYHIGNCPPKHKALIK